ncbi:MAG: S8 family serine peptidase [Bacteroidota bacterium]
MATVYVIYAEGDRPAVVEQVLPTLPSNGYRHWLARHHLAGSEPGPEAAEEAMYACDALLIVLSSATLEAPSVLEDVRIALGVRRTRIVVQLGEVEQERADALLPAKVWTQPKVDFAAEEDAEHLLVGLLPPVEAESASGVPEGAERIEWNEEIFSTALAEATARRDHAHARALVGAFLDHLDHRPYPYPSTPAFTDLKALRQARAFELMRRYGRAVLANGVRQDRVRRMYAQALIETRYYEHALEVLRSILDDAESSQDEIFEAYGLTGRTFKQRYVNAPSAAGAAPLLRRAIAAYETAYEEDPRNFWHGVNAASCMLRAERDGVGGVPPGRAQDIARRIVQDLEVLAQLAPLAVWDCASRVEAWLALERYDEAEGALEIYLRHPDMQAFEVSSTLRQFDEVLELERTPRGAALLVRLRQAVERYRADTVKAPPPAKRSRGTEEIARATPLKALVIRLDVPDWDLSGITDLEIRTRLGQIVTARGTDESIRQLLSDARVISVEESRPAGQVECDRSVPFIQVPPGNSFEGGAFTETGDRALIAVIDDGIDVLHEAFLDASGRSRILGIWDQTDSSGPPPPASSGGTFYDTATIASYVQAGSVPHGLRARLGTHGTHVASIAGGRAVGAFAGGVAPEAKLLIVVSGSAGQIGYSQSHLEALAFIDSFAEARKLPVVVNVSQGMNAGAHDGLSALEAGFDEFSNSGRKPGRVVVKSAGNERSKHGHAKVTLLSYSSERLRWKRHASAGYTERLELWWSSADEVAFRLRDPFGAESPWVETAAPGAQGVFPNGGPYCLTFTKRHVDNGASLLLVELGDAIGDAATGEWEIEMHSGLVRDGSAIHCWIERDNGTPSSFLNFIDEKMTLTIPGTASSVITVGAVETGLPIQVWPRSSYGPTSTFSPTRRSQRKPHVCAPGVKVQAARAGTPRDVRTASGTSMAAPHVAGAIALVLSRAAKAGLPLGSNQIAETLRVTTKNYSGHWDRGQGYGIIDVAALLAAFE